MSALRIVPTEHRRGGLLGLAFLLLAVFASSAGAAEDLDRELAVVAKGIKQLLDGRGLDTIAVGEFIGPARAASSGGAGIKQALIEQLKKAGLRMNRKADLEIKGDYLDVEDEKTKLLALRLKAVVVDRQGNEITHFERGLFNVTTIAALMGTTVQISPDASVETRDQKVREGIDNPHFQIDGARVSAGPDSPYAIEILVKTPQGHEPRAVKLDDGLAFVPLRRDEIYAVRLINRSEFEAAVTLTIDGLSVFAFRESKDPKTDKPLPRYTHIVVPAQGEATVFGWNINDDETDSFQIVELPKGAAAELNVKGKIGTITASFAAAWPKGSNPPPDEGADNTRAADATGRGPRIGVQVEAVVRDLGKVRASVSVRYTK